MDGTKESTVSDINLGAGSPPVSPLTGAGLTGLGWHHQWNIDHPCPPALESWGKFGGVLDEIRVSPTRRSANWIWASYMTMASNTAFTSYGNVAQRRPISDALLLLR